MRLLATLVVFGLLCVSSRGSAEPKKSPSAKSDASDSPANDGTAAQRTYEKLVAVADADGDGRVTGNELELLVVRYVRKQVDARFRRLDRNADGRVSRAEVPSMVAVRFARFDENGDGAFTAAELSKIMLREAAERCRVVFARLDGDADGALAVADAHAARPVELATR